MSLHIKRGSLRLPLSVDEAWEFLSNPKNLKIITPEAMGFTIVSGADRPIYPGQIIEYDVTPLSGFKTRWVSEITHVIDRSYFVDVQLQGPYAFWHHKHFITGIPGGVLMEDEIHYRLPLGFLGDLLHPILVKPKLDEIFAYRTKKLTELFGTLD